MNNFPVGIVPGYLKYPTHIFYIFILKTGVQTYLLFAKIKYSNRSKTGILRENIAFDWKYRRCALVFSFDDITINQANYHTICLRRRWHMQSVFYWRHVIFPFELTFRTSFEGVIRCHVVCSFHCSWLLRYIFFLLAANQFIQVTRNDFSRQTVNKEFSWCHLCVLFVAGCMLFLCSFAYSTKSNLRVTIIH